MIHDLNLFCVPCNVTWQNSEFFLVERSYSLTNFEISFQNIHCILTPVFLLYFLRLVKTNHSVIHYTKTHEKKELFLFFLTTFLKMVYSMSFETNIILWTSPMHKVFFKNHSLLKVYSPAMLYDFSVIESLSCFEKSPWYSEMSIEWINIIIYLWTFNYIVWCRTGKVVL